MEKPRKSSADKSENQKRKRKRMVIRNYLPVNPKREMERNWDTRFATEFSESNKKLHPFYRQYFGKAPKELQTTFRIKYANSSNELPGIVDLQNYQAKQR
jgi:hypothetical protein